MIYPLSEIFDRLTIETRKSHYGADNATVIEAYRHAISHASQLGLSRVIVANICFAVIELALANCDIANLEWAIRENKELAMEEVGRRALAIRDINARRIAAKNLLARYFGEPPTPPRADRKEKFTHILQSPTTLLVDGEVMAITKYDVPRGRITVVRGKRAKTPRSRKA